MKNIKNWKTFESEQSLLNITQDESTKLMKCGNTNYFKKNIYDLFEPSKLKDSIENLDVDSIKTFETPSEEKLNRYGEYKIPEYRRLDSGYPVAIRYRNQIILLDGHHRLELAKRAGQKTIEVAVKDIN